MVNRCLSTTFYLNSETAMNYGQICTVTNINLIILHIHVGNRLSISISTVEYD